MRSKKGSQEPHQLTTSFLKFFGTMIGLHRPLDLGRGPGSWGKRPENHFSLYSAVQGRILVGSHEEDPGDSWSHCQSGRDSNWWWATLRQRKVPGVGRLWPPTSSSSWKCLRVTCPEYYEIEMFRIIQGKEDMDKMLHCVCLRSSGDDFRIWAINKKLWMSMRIVAFRPAMIYMPFFSTKVDRRDWS